MLKRWDDFLYRIERSIVGALFLAMSVVVFLDVVHRVFSRSPGRFAVILQSILFRLGVETSPEQLDAIMVPALLGLLTFLLAWGAARTYDRHSRKPSRFPAWGRAAVGTAACAGAIQLFIAIRPEGLVWSPYFGLCALLWIGLIGASMAVHTNQHLALEMAEKIWPEKWLPTVRSINQVLVAAFCFLIAFLGTLSVVDHFQDWQGSAGAGLIPSIDWPKWIVYLVIPYSFGMMGLRLLARATRLLPTPEAPMEGMEVKS